MLDRAAQGAGGIAIPESVSEIFRCCTKGSGLVEAYWWTVGLDDFGGFFQPW